MLLPALAFLFGSAIIGAAAFVLVPSRAAMIDRRLEDLLGERKEEVEAKPRFQRLLAFVKRVGDKAPRSPKEMGSLRLRLVQAGYRRDDAITVFFGIRVCFALALFGLFSTSLVGRPNLMLALGG